MNRLSLLAGALLATPVFAATPSFGTATNWTTTIDAATYNGSTGSITFNDWGYKGPTGVGANDFQVGSGFNSSQIGQIQNVVTKPADWLTPDAPQGVVKDLATSPTYPNANMDTQVQFYKWGYTTTDSTANASHFNSMEIDKAGNYYVPKANMQFGFYNTFVYNNGSTITPVNTSLNFQPLAISDAKGWCGSVLAPSPNAVQPMGGQVTFDFAFKVYFDTGNNSAVNPGTYSSTQIVPGFVMRSYGSYDVNVTTGGGDVQHFTGSAVMNNTNPLTGLADPNYQNQVSFLGAGVVPLGAWVYNDGTANVTVAAVQGAGGTPGEVRADGATWHQNAFAGFAFLMRADANRTVTYINPNGWSDYVAAVPEPSSYAMMGVGLGLVGMMARRRNKRA